MQATIVPVTHFVPVHRSVPNKPERRSAWHNVAVVCASLPGLLASIPEGLRRSAGSTLSLSFEHHPIKSRRALSTSWLPNPSPVPMINIREAYATAARSAVTPRPDSSGKTTASEKPRKPATLTSETGSQAKLPNSPEADIVRAAVQAERTTAQVGLVERPLGWATLSTSLPPVKGHSVQSNKQAADLFKALLEDDDEEVGSSPTIPNTPQARKEEDHCAPNSSCSPNSAISPSTASGGSRALLDAFNNACWPIDPSPRKRNLFAQDDGGLTARSDQARLNAQNALHARLSGQSVAEALAAGTVKLKRRKKLSGAPVALVLPGLGEGRTRSEYGKSLSSSSTETGVGVFGHLLAPSTRSTPIPEPAVRPDGGATSEPEVTPADMGVSCDLPMPQGGGASNRIVSLGGEGTRYQVGKYTIDLSPDLPALAAEHPARVWNQMLHSLTPRLQPIIKWDYRSCEPEGLQIACLTLVLPPTHPSIAHHPLFSILPANRYTREYMASVEALGGIKQWIGEPRKYKADAQNTTLVRCIAEDALAWVLDPVLEVPPDEEAEDIGRPPRETAVTHAETVTLGHSGTAFAPEDAVQACSPQAFPEASSCMRELPIQSPNTTPRGEAGPREAVTSPGRGVRLLPGLAVEGEPFEPESSYEDYGYSMRVAGGTDKTDDVHPTAPRQNPEPLYAPRFQPQVSSHTIKPEVFPVSQDLSHGITSPVKGVSEVDWQAQLKHFCEMSGLPYPKYGQQIQKKPGGTTFLGTLDLENEQFVSTVPRSLLKVARRDVAKLVFVDYFGQEPSTLA